MTGGKRKRDTLQELLDRPWCYYCLRDFDDYAVLQTHQREQHFQCDRCTRRLNTASGLKVHSEQVHKVIIDTIKNTVPGRESPHIEIFGVLGIPDEIMTAHQQNIIDGWNQRAAAHRARTGNPLPGTVQHDPNKKGKRAETKEEIRARLDAFRAEKKARKEAEEKAKIAAAVKKQQEEMMTAPDFEPPEPMENPFPQQAGIATAFTASPWENRPPPKKARKGLEMDPEAILPPNPKKKTREEKEMDREAAAAVALKNRLGAEEAKALEQKEKVDEALAFQERLKQYAQLPNGFTAPPPVPSSAAFTQGLPAQPSPAAFTHGLPAQPPPLPFTQALPMPPQLPALPQGLPFHPTVPYASPPPFQNSGVGPYNYPLPEKPFYQPTGVGLPQRPAFDAPNITTSDMAALHPRGYQQLTPAISPTLGVVHSPPPPVPPRRLPPLESKRGVRGYFEQFIPQGTRLAWMDPLNNGGPGDACFEQHKANNVIWPLGNA